MADRPEPSMSRTARRRYLRRAIATAAVACVSLGSGSGCSMISGMQKAVVHNECVDDFLVGYRNRAWSAKAWHQQKHRFCDRKHQADFRAGFRQGYEDVAAGRDGCVPALAPESYWGWRYQSAEGQSKVSAWFEGYPLGAAAAEKDGVGNWGTIRSTLPMNVSTGPGGYPSHDGIIGSSSPTPADPGDVGSSTLAGTEGAINAAGPELGSIDFETMTKVPVSSVPTAASGRPPAPPVPGPQNN